MVYFKIDNLSCVIEKVSLEKLFEIFHIDSCFFPDFLLHAHEGLMTGLPAYILHEYGLHISINGDEYLSAKASEDCDLFYFEFRKIRIELSGTGLDWIRTFYLTFDDDILKPEFFGNNIYRITRCDFAFDFVNCHKNFLNDLSQTLLDIEMYRRRHDVLSDRLSVRTGVSVTFDVYIGNQGLTCYLGKKGGNKFVRIYDKLQEITKARGFSEEALPKFDHPLDEHISSWFRVELQTRKRYCEPYLYGTDDRGEAILKKIFNDYRVTDLGNKIDCIEHFMNWDNMPELRKMKNTSNESKNILSVVNDRVDRAMTNLIIFILKNGLDGLFRVMTNYINTMEDGSLLGSNRRLALVRKLNLIMQQENITPYDFKYLDKSFFESQHFIDFDYFKLFDDLNSIITNSYLHNNNRYIKDTKESIG